MNEEIRDKARDLASNAKQQVSSQYEKQRDTATGELGSLASALRTAGNQLNATHAGGFSGRIISTVADRIETFSRSVEGKDLDGIVDDVESFARRNPAVFLGTAVAAGFLVSRFLKSSGRRSMSSYDAYSHEAYGGFHDRGSDVAIGSNAAGTGTTGMGTTGTGTTGFSSTAGAGHGAGGGIGSTTDATTPGITTATERR